MRLKHILIIFLLLIIPFVSYCYLVLFYFNTNNIYKLSKKACNVNWNFTEEKPELFLLNNFHLEDTLIRQVVNSHILRIYHKFGGAPIAIISNFSKPLSSNEIDYLKLENPNISEKWRLQSFQLDCIESLKPSSNQVLLLDEDCFIVGSYNGTSRKEMDNLMDLIRIKLKL